jgi:hypothetical protein
MRAESNAIVVAIQLGVGAALSIVADPFDERVSANTVWRKTQRNRDNFLGSHWNLSHRFRWLGPVAS